MDNFDYKGYISNNPLLRENNENDILNEGVAKKIISKLKNKLANSKTVKKIAKTIVDDPKTLANFEKQLKSKGVVMENLFESNGDEGIDDSELIKLMQVGAESSKNLKEDEYTHYDKKGREIDGKTKKVKASQFASANPAIFGLFFGPLAAKLAVGLLEPLMNLPLIAKNVFAMGGAGGLMGLIIGIVAAQVFAMKKARAADAENAASRK